MLKPAWIFSPRTELYLRDLVSGSDNPSFPDMNQGLLRKIRYLKTTQIPNNLAVCHRNETSRKFIWLTLVMSLLGTGRWWSKRARKRPASTSRRDAGRTFAGSVPGEGGSSLGPGTTPRRSRSGLYGRRLVLSSVLRFKRHPRVAGFTAPATPFPPDSVCMRGRFPRGARFFES